MRDGITVIKDRTATLNIVIVILVFLAFDSFWSLSGSMQVGSSEVREPDPSYFFCTLLMTLGMSELAWGRFFVE